MPANGMDTGAESESVALTAPNLDEAEATPLQLSRIAPRTPAGVPALDPLLGAGTPAKVTQGYRELRFALETARSKAGVRTIGITSVGEGDGRSVVATNLALSLTEGGRRRVVLVDAAFERPAIARMLDAEAPAGLAEVLAGRMPLEAALFAAGRPGLFALPAGNPSTTGLEPLDALETFAAVVDRLATVFDFVIVDTPPLTERVDAAAFASKLDGVVMVVRAKKTTAPDLERAINRFGEGKILGLVLNASKG
jgi:succinoglycan biosynthesis transport protein ExoP